ncbi:GDSL family lipase [Paenibacillus sp. PR3]|uniref:GDSL family lipase n=1 Tax=Paenibacillus terricola TaxID=2763503 RepID=A0ABR8MX27_9BACL|nr:SGNH/GDSL hydrolase family protein [Paenibacillus terricola]MBD3920518.1 GDSL family lipase [Paenibacillus terricola]
MRTEEQLQVHALTDIDHLKIHGRTTGRLSPLTLFWTGSGMELNAKASELWIEVEAHYYSYEPWISIVINGAVVSRQMITEGRRWICVFRGMNGDAVKNVRIVKDVQAMSEDPRCSLQIHAVKFDGELLPVEDRPNKIEFIGDSITSGEGSTGANQEADWIPMWFSALDNYTAITADALNADYRVVSQSGWGVLTSWDNNPNNNIPAYYEQVCGLLTGDDNEGLGAHESHDFAAWQPDVVVVNLGTNDGGAFYSAEWRDPSTGEIHKQRLNEDGSFNGEDLAAFELAAEQFLVKLRRNNPKAHIVWAYGMLGTPMLPAISRAVEAYANQSGDRMLSICELPNTTDETVGARSHPGLLAHRQAALVLTKHIERLLI